MANNDGDAWVEELRELCLDYDIPLNYLNEILGDPKVLPMIRGKAFEYSAQDKLRHYLPDSKWSVSKPRMNAQAGEHDVDLIVEHLDSGQKIRIECKLAKKGSFKIPVSGIPRAAVKCMRSRTIGEEVIRSRAVLLDLSEETLRSHKDNYRDNEFDFVISSLSNSFYKTNLTTLRYYWSATEPEIKFLKSLSTQSGIEPKTITFDYLFLAPARELTPARRGTNCPRETCAVRSSCSFIPNYPLVEFDKNSGLPIKPWVAINDTETTFLEYLENRKAPIDSVVHN